MNWATLIPLLGYLLILSGLLRLFFPAFVFKQLSRLTLSTYTYSGIICLIASLLLIYQGFIIGIA